MMNLATDFLPTCRASTVANYARLATQFLSASTRLCSPACPALPCPLTVTSAPSRPASFLTYVAATLNQSLGRVVKKQGMGGEGRGGEVQLCGGKKGVRYGDWTETGLKSGSDILVVSSKIIYIAIGGGGMSAHEVQDSECRWTVMVVKVAGDRGTQPLTPVNLPFTVCKKDKNETIFQLHSIHHNYRRWPAK